MCEISSELVQKAFDSFSVCDGFLQEVVFLGYVQEHLFVKNRIDFDFDLAGDKGGSCSELQMVLKASFFESLQVVFYPFELSFSEKVVQFFPEKDDLGEVAEEELNLFEERPSEESVEVPEDVKILFAFFDGF